MTAAAPLLRLVAGVLALVLLAAGCSSSEEEPDPSPESSAPAAPTTLTFAVYGPPPVITAYSKIAADFTAEHPDTVVNVQPYDTHAEAMRALEDARARGEAPDLFLMDRDDMAALHEDGALRRVDDLLAERQVDFGDGYTRSGLAAFSADSALQCMPADISPLVVYYNPRLIDLSLVAEPGANPVDQENGWGLDEFARAALQPRRPGTRGMHIAPELEYVAPFVFSGGGELVDDVDEPTRLTLSEGSSASAMERLLELVRDPSLTFNQDALRKRSALERFKAGQLGMILGYRSLTPKLREQNMVFDVMPLPRLGSGATVATMSGLCISESAPAGKAADLLSHVISDKSAETLAASGYVMPANLDVLNSEAFQQPGQFPEHATVFSEEVRDIRPMPTSSHWPEVRARASRMLVDLFYEPVILPLEERLAAIDTASEPVFDPTVTPDDETSSAAPETLGSTPSPAPTPRTKPRSTASATASAPAP